MRENKGVTLVNMVIIIVVLIIIAGVSIIGGSDILQSSKDSKKEENLSAVKSVVNQVSIEKSTAGVFSPGTTKLYGKTAKNVLSGDTEVLKDWYILDSEALEEMGIEYVDEDYLVNYEENKVYPMSEYEKDRTILSN